MHAQINPYRDLLNAHNVPPAGYDQNTSDNLSNNGAQTDTGSAEQAFLGDLEEFRNFMA